MAIFQSHRLWELSKDYIVLPDDNDQQMIHDFIYQGIKKRGDIRAFIPFLESLLSKYKVDSFISGCTELHLLAKYLASNGNGEGYGCIDPLTIVAKEISTLSHCLTREPATRH
jgi:aspartate racemase